MVYVPVVSETLDYGRRAGIYVFNAARRNAVTGAVIVTLALVGGTALGGVDGIKYRGRKLEDFVGRYTGGAQGLRAHSRLFRLERYTHDQLNPNSIRYETFFEGDPFDRFPDSRKGRRVVINLELDSGNPEQDREDTSRELVDLVRALNECEGAVFVSVPKPDPSEIMKGVQTPERKFNDETQLFVNDTDSLTYHCYLPVHLGHRPRMGR